MRSLLGISSALALTLAAGPFVRAAWSQAADDDLYGVPGATSETTPASSAPSSASSASDTLEAPAPDSAPDTVDAAVSAPAPAATPAPADTVRRPPRPPVVRETTINPMDTQRGGYRNPKKALFMSLMVPGLGQAYVGQSTFTYARAAFYFGTELTLGLMWYQFSVVKYDRQVKRYQAHADEHFSITKYEDALFLETPQPEAEFRALNPYRLSYCEAIQEDVSSQGQKSIRGCKEVYTTDATVIADYQFFADQYNDRDSSAAARGAMRDKFVSPVEFYQLIGGYQEFIAGWDDATGVLYTDSLIAGASANRDVYNAMRRKAQDYSRMQAWFIGGIVLNHIASAVDAALTARHNNKRLYGEEARWYDRTNLDGGLAFEQGRPRTYLTARLSF